jgi:hypothetical protein
MPRHNKPPSYLLHKQSGQAVVTLTDGLGTRRDVLLGRFGSPESRAEYARVIAEWEAAGRRLPQKAGAAPDLSLNELALAYYRHAESYYGYGSDRGRERRDGACLRDALRSSRSCTGTPRPRTSGRWP